MVVLCMGFLREGRREGEKDDQQGENEPRDRPWESIFFHDAIPFGRRPGGVCISTMTNQAAHLSGE
jgi:hypothetical protein